MLLSTLHPVWSSCSEYKSCSATKRFYRRLFLWVRTSTFPFFRTDTQFVWPNARQVSLLYPVMQVLIALKKVKYNSSCMQEVLKRGNRIVLSEVGWPVTHLWCVLVKNRIILYSCISKRSLCLKLPSLTKKWQLIPMYLNFIFENGQVRFKWLFK